MRQYSFVDRFLMECEAAAQTLFNQSRAERGNPGASSGESSLSSAQQKHSAGLMRVNHTGEVCAQALYRGQLCVAKNPTTRSMLEHACAEEVDHLAWTQQRLHELNSHTSYLNIFWYTNSFVLGMLAGFAGDRWSLGFVEETERQVGKHLQGHLQDLPETDLKSRAIVAQMHEDEVQHGASAARAGASELPAACKMLMRWQAKVMTTLAYWV